MNLYGNWIIRIINILLPIYIAINAAGDIRHKWELPGLLAFLSVCLTVSALGLPLYGKKPSEYKLKCFRIRLVLLVGLTVCLSGYPVSMECLRVMIILDALASLTLVKAICVSVFAWVLMAAISVGPSYLAGGTPVLYSTTVVPGMLTLLGSALGLVYVALQDEQINSKKILSRHKETLSKLAESNVELQNYAVQAKRLAAMEERERIARDIHDTLGHTLTAIVFQAMASRKVVYTCADQVMQDLNEIVHAGQSGLKEVRRTLEKLRMEDDTVESGRSLWTRVAQVFARVTDMKVTLDISSEFDKISNEIKWTVYRLVQESLTNACRHGHAKWVDIAIWWEEGLFMVRISDNGYGTEKIEEGMGLRGLRERITALGGDISYRCESGCGFDIGVEIPLKECEI